MTALGSQNWSVGLKWFEIVMYVCGSGGKKCSFFGKFGVLSFFETPVLKFTLLPYYQRYMLFIICHTSIMCNHVTYK